MAAPPEAWGGGPVTGVAAGRRVWRRVSTLGTCVRVIVGEEKCDPRLRVPSGGGRKAWRPRGGAVAGFSRYGGGGRRRPSSLRAGGELSGKDSGPECLFSCLGGDGCCKMVRGSRGGMGGGGAGGQPVVSHSYLCWRDCAEGCVRKLPWTCYRVVTTCSVLEPCFHNLWLACRGIYFSTCQFAAYKELLLAAAAAAAAGFFFPFSFFQVSDYGPVYRENSRFYLQLCSGTGLEKLAGEPVFVSMYL